MVNVFEKFYELFSERYSKQSVLTMGEDSVRYDFFRAIIEEMKIENWEINVEFPISENAFLSNLHENSKRKESPVIDLFINSSKEKSIYEFGFFRRNSEDKSNINVTEKTFKMFNDFLRLALQKFYANKIEEAYFVCVADEKILGSKYNKISEIGVFPSKEYLINIELLGHIKELYKSSKEISDKFLKAFEAEKNINTIKAELFFDKNLNANNLGNLKAKILIYKITIT